MKKKEEKKLEKEEKKLEKQEKKLKEKQEKKEKVKKVTPKKLTISRPLFIDEQSRLSIQQRLNSDFKSKGGRSSTLSSIDFTTIESSKKTVTAKYTSPKKKKESYDMNISSPFSTPRRNRVTEMVIPTEDLVDAPYGLSLRINRYTNANEVIIYIIKVKTEDSTWFVPRRYNQFHKLWSTVKKKFFEFILKFFFFQHFFFK